MCVCVCVYYILYIFLSTEDHVGLQRGGNKHQEAHLPKVQDICKEDRKLQDYCYLSFKLVKITLVCKETTPFLTLLVLIGKGPLSQFPPIVQHFSFLLLNPKNIIFAQFSSFIYLPLYYPPTQEEK